MDNSMRSDLHCCFLCFFIYWLIDTNIEPLILAAFWFTVLCLRLFFCNILDQFTLLLLLSCL